MTTEAALFDTALGRIGIAWRDDVVVAVQLPERDDETTMLRMAQTVGMMVPAEPSTAITDAMAAIADLLDGGEADLDFIEIDLGTRSEFDSAVYAVTRAIPAGESLTYGEVAERVGQPGAAQAVGRAMGANPIPVIVPCHRVLGAKGQLIGFSAAGGVETKRKMLLIEGCPAIPPSLFD